MWGFSLRDHRSTMRLRRTKAKIRVACRTFLEGEAGAAETCCFLVPFVFQRVLLLPKNQENFLTAVASETDNLPVGKLRDNWHPAFVGPKLEQLRIYEASIQREVELICRSILNQMPEESEQHTDDQ